MGADVLRRVKTFFFFVGERPDLNSGKLAKMAFAGQENSKKRHKDTVTARYVCCGSVLSVV